LPDFSNFSSISRLARAPGRFNETEGGKEKERKRKEEEGSLIKISENDSHSRAGCRRDAGGGGAGAGEVMGLSKCARRWQENKRGARRVRDAIDLSDDGATRAAVTRR
jgi:hypothetical protein